MHRTTIRKRIINHVLNELFQGGPVLLEELRWNALLIEHENKGLNLSVMSRSLRNSFARTIRDFIPQIKIQKLPRPDGLHIGIVSRAAVYRLSSWDAIQCFMRSDNPTVLTCRKGKEFSYLQRIVICQLFAEYPQITYKLVQNIPKWDRTYLVGRIVFPVSIPLTLITTRTVTATDLKKVANVSWKIYRDLGPGDSRKNKLLRNNQSVRSHWPGGYIRNPLSKGPWSII